MPIAIDHVVVAVNDLKRTVADYESLGFTVTIGGEHAHRGSHNALIVFQDGSYIELIAFRHEPPVKDNDWWDLLQIGEGLADGAVISADLVAESNRLRAADLTVAEPFRGGRHRPDGIEIAWLIGRVITNADFKVPFVIEDVTPHDLRVPGGPQAVHANGTTGIAGFTFGVPDRSRAEESYVTVFGEPDAEGRYSVGSQWVALVDPASGGPAAAALIGSRGAIPVSVTLSGTNRDLPLNLTHGATFIIS